jgi:tRNA pseudouridine38-40 synthase
VHTFRLTLEYDGTEYSGWQRQPDRRTVEGVLRAAITAVTGEDPPLTAAGRTDAGAHSHGQVVGCGLERAWSPSRLAAALNAKLPADVVVREADEAPAEFHARYDAKSRSYRYVVVSRRQRGPMTRRFAWEVSGSLDIDAMQEAAACVIGTHDFGAFGKAPNGGSTTRTVNDISVRRVPFSQVTDAAAVVIEVNANAFLTGMMRGIAGALVSVGKGDTTIEDFRVLLNEPRVNPIHLIVAPAHGLHQWKVTY